MTQNLYVRPLYERDSIDIKLGDYVKYVDSITTDSMTDAGALIDFLDLTTPLYTFTNIVIGGFRNANQMHYYDAQSYRDRNAFGYEVGVSANGIVVSAGTLVDLPEGDSFCPVTLRPLASFRPKCKSGTISSLTETI